MMLDDQDAASALEIVEDFFALKIDDPMFDISPDIPGDQLAELARRMYEHLKRIDGGLGPKSEMLAGAFASDNVTLVAGLSNGRGRPALSIPDLKLQLTLCQRSVVPDLLLSWGSKTSLDEALGRIVPAEARHRLLLAIRQLRPLAPAIRAGHLVCVPPADEHHLNPEYRSALSDLTFRSWDFARYDPVARHILLSKLGFTDYQLRGRYTGQEMLRDLEEGIDTGLRWDIGPRLLEEYGVSEGWKLAEACHFWTLCSTFRIRPLVSRQEVARHFRWATKLAAADAVGHDVTSPSGAVPALELALPSLNNLTIEQLVNLRSQEDIWTELRDALTAAESAASDLHLEDLEYLAFLEAVRECTQDIAGPAAEKLRRDLRRNKWKAIGISLTGAGLVRLALHGIGILYPPANAAGAPASTATKAWLTRSQAGRQQAYETASTLMLDLSAS